MDLFTLISVVVPFVGGIILCLLDKCGVFSRPLIKLLMPVVFAEICLCIIIFLLLPFAATSIVTQIFVLSPHKPLVYFLDGVILTEVVAALATGLQFFQVNAQTGSLQNDALRFERGLRGIIAVYFLGTSLGKVIYFDSMLSFFEFSGYSMNFLIVITLLEGLCAAVLLIFPRLTVYACFALVAVMIGATITHYSNYVYRSAEDPFGNSLDSLKMHPILWTIFFSA